MATDRRAFLALTGLSVLGGCLGSAGPGGSGTAGPDTTDTADADPLESPVATAPIPNTPAEFRYATMGAGEESAVTYYGSWKCPYCAQFSQGFPEEIVTNFIEPTGLSLTFRAIGYIGGEPFLGPDAARAARAGLTVWNLDPGTYGAYHEYLLANQPPEGKRWATVDRLVRFAREAGVGPIEKLRSHVTSGRYEEAVRATAAAAQQAGVESTPILVIDGRTVSPLDAPGRTRRLLDQAASD